MNRSTPPDVTASAWTILIRLQVGLMVFFPEGIQKLIHPDILGAGRFARIGIPFPDLMGPFVGVVETVCGLLLIIGLFTRLAAIPLIIIMIVALVSTSCQFCSAMTYGFSISHRTSNGTDFGASCTKRGPISPCCWVASFC